jgi:hypothetical protein
MLHDEYLSLDTACAKTVLDLRSYNTAGALLAFSTRSHQLMLRDARNDANYRASTDGSLSSVALYRYNIGREMQKLGIQHADSLRMLDACVKTEAKFCMERERYVYVNFWSVIWSTWLLTVGFALLVLGLAGSLFLTPLAATWRASGGRLVDWIQRGS